MDKHLFFTGPNCSGCKTLKTIIESNNLQDSFTFVDVEADPQLAMQHRIRTLPTIVSTNYTPHIGTAKGASFIKTL